MQSLKLLAKRVFVGPNADMALSDNGVRFIQGWEKLKLDSYPDSGGVWTIGWGTTKGVGPNMHITKDKADELFLRDVSEDVDCVRRLITVPLSQNQFDALVSFTYNVGQEALRVSTLRRILNTGEYKAVPQQLLRWVRVKGKVNDGLVNRRTAEAELFTS